MAMGKKKKIQEEVFKIFIMHLNKKIKLMSRMKIKYNFVKKWKCQQ